MAEKGFGVKEINLIGPSGTPTIESPNNLNLNAVNVAISTNATIGGTLAVTGNVSVGGTLTYEDVTSIDSVGIITARSGVDVDDFISVGSNIHLGNAGVVTATTFSGSAASLTSIPAANITGTLPAISGANLTNLPADTPTNSDIQVAYTVTANGSSAYRFAGNGVVSTADDPDLYLIRGQKYRFINNSGGSHPFQIREASGGTAYSTGVTNNGASSGNIDFAPTYDSPAQLVYQCTSHSGMVGNIYLRDAAGGNTNVGVTTFTDTLEVKGSSGGTLKVTGSAAHTSKIVVADNGGTGNGNCLVEGGDGSDFFTIQSNGNVNFASGNGITFADSSTSQVLDDYEEGSWTPTFVSTGASWAYNHQYGYYQKVGNTVHVSFYITLGNGTVVTGTTSNSLHIAVPFTATGATRYEAACCFSMIYKFNLNASSAADIPLTGRLYSGNSKIDLLAQFDDAAGYSYTAVKANQAGCGLAGSITYRV